MLIKKSIFTKKTKYRMKPTLFVLLVLLSMTGYSQINFERGYFINNNRSKTECLIKNVAWKDNPVDFEYKLAEGSETQVNGIKDVSEFNVGGYKFKRYDLKIERSSNNPNTMDTRRELFWQSEMLFLKVLVEGKATLYQYEDGNLIKYFYSTGDHLAAEQLIFKEYVSNGVIKRNSQFQQQLYTSMKDRIESVKRFENAKYRKDSLVKLFNEYNASGDKDAIDYTTSHNQSNIYLKFTPGIGFSNLGIENSRLQKYNTEFGSKIIYRIGLEIEYIMPFNNRKWSLFIDPNYQSYKNEAPFADSKVNVEYNVIELPTGVRHYFYLNDTSKIFLNAAYVLNFTIGNSQVQFGSQDPLEIERTAHLAFGGGFGYKDFSIEARYNLSRDILQSYMYWPADYTSLNIIAGYRFL